MVEFEVPRHNNLSAEFFFNCERSDSLGFANSIPLLTTPCDGTARAVGGCLGMEVREGWSCTARTGAALLVPRMGATPLVPLLLTSVISGTRTNSLVTSVTSPVTSVTSSSSYDLGQQVIDNDLGQSESCVQSDGKCQTHLRLYSISEVFVT